jgi:hemolysin activation/secretion protein
VYKQISWYQYGSRQAEDHFRSVQWQLDFNRPDRNGRWVVNNLIEKGLPHLFGGAKAKDEGCSVPSSGGGYTREHLTVARRQKLVNDIDLILKGHYQVSSETLTGVNVFSVGGIMGVIDNRGYPRAQSPGDSGWSLTAALSLPPFGVPRTMGVPGSKTKFYDAFRWFPFMDYAVAILKSPKLGEDKVNTLTSAGLGATFTVPDQSLSMRLDVGWPVTKDKPNDGDRPHVWWSITKGF